mmetsp:Transcript_9125/g.13679  ORF Transcript_9125/g.13679 Transcript_9125/m.13679 type:complete len:351 (+) Transcript_9125:19-1071(+)
MEPIWLDCDPGHDDAFAILLSLYSGKSQLLGISTVAGNQTVDKTFRNAKLMLKVAAKEAVPVVKGLSKPLLRSARHDPDIHGHSGLEGCPELDSFAEAEGLKVPHEEDKKSTSSFKPNKNLWVIKMARIIARSKEPVNIVATGALTNVATLITLFPDILKNVKQISIMGGAIGTGNRSPVAEFNILCDPEAAKIVFNCPKKVVMVPLEATHTALATDSVLKQISSMKTPFSKMCVDLLTFFKYTYKHVFGFESPPVHDPCAVAYVIYPEIFQTRHLHVDVICGEHKCAGQTVCDVWEDFSKEPKNVHVAIKMDTEKFWDIMIAALKKCNDETPLNAYVSMRREPVTRSAL